MMQMLGTGSAAVIGLLVMLSGCTVQGQQVADAFYSILPYSELPSSLVSKKSSVLPTSDYDDSDYSYENGLPALSEEVITRNSTTTVVNLNAFVDGMLGEAGQILNEKLPLPVSPVRSLFSLELGNKRLKGMLRAPYGVLDNVGHVVRAGDISLVKENNTITSTGAFRFHGVNILFNKVYVNFLNTFVMGSVNVSVSDVYTRYTYKFVYVNNTACHFKIEDFELSLFKIKVYVDGQSEQEFTISYWLGAILNYLRDDIRSGSLEYYSRMIKRNLALVDCTTVYQHLFPFD